MTLALLCCMVNSLSAAEFGNFLYTDNGASISITGYYPRDASGAVVIPSTINGKPVTSIGNGAFATCTGMTSVTIPTSVTSIGDRAFDTCVGLTSITIPNGMTSIGSGAFAQCASLTNVTIPSSVTSIAESTFSACVGLTSVTIPASVTSIGSWAFEGCKRLTSVTIPAGVTSIAVSTFEACTGLTSVTIPPSVTTIGSNAFYACFNLTSIKIPAGLTTIGSFTFAGCTHLTNVTIPAGVTSMGGQAFYNCASLTSVSFLGNAPTMGSNVFFQVPSGFTVYYFNGKSGFTSPTWSGYSAVNIGYPAPIASWLLTNGFTSNADLQSDPNGDGVNLLMAYALNLNPKQNLQGCMPNPVIAGSQMGLTFYAGSVGVAYTVETSTDLTNWSATGVTVSAPDANNVRTATVPMSDPNRFMRLVVGY